MIENTPIGIQLALETIVEPTWKRINEDREIPNRDLLANVEYIYFDIYSIMREIVNDGGITFSISEIHERCDSVISTLSEIPELGGILRFVNTFVYASKIPKQIKMPVKDTKKSKMMRLLESAITSYRIKTSIVTNLPTRNVILFTHHTTYLATMIDIGKQLIILESHTGILLTNNLLGKKYRKTNLFDVRQLPLTLSLLKVIGDDNYVLGDKDLFKKHIKSIISWNLKTPKSTINKTLK